MHGSPRGQRMQKNAVSLSCGSGCRNSHTKPRVLLNKNGLVCRRSACPAGREAFSSSEDCVPKLIFKRHSKPQRPQLPFRLLHTEQAVDGPWRGSRARALGWTPEERVHASHHRGLVRAGRLAP